MAEEENISPGLKTFLREQFEMITHAVNSSTKLSADMEWLFRQLSNMSLKPFAEGLIVALKLTPEQSETVRLAATAPVLDLSPKSYQEFIEEYIQRLQKQEQEAKEEVANSLSEKGVKF